MSSSPFAKTLTLTLAFALAVFSMILLSNTPVMAQATTGTLRGTVLDPNGAAVAGAAVTVKNEATGIETTSTSNSEGAFTITSLLPGKYSVTVAPSSGFKTKTTTGVDVRLGQDTEIKVGLEVGVPSETVTITGNTEEIVQTNSQISSSFETRKVEELPSNAAGSGIDTLALLAPGVVPGFGNVNGNGITLSVNGNRARANNFTLDGTDNNDLSLGGPNLFVDNQDAVAEFQIITNNYSAQYGRNQGAIVNIVTKSGTNTWHGSAFEFHRNSSALDAMTNQERAEPTRSQRDKFISNVFGGTVGGPIVKNKAFFFFDGQLIRQRQQLAFAAANPAITRAGLATLGAAFPGNPAIQALVNQGVFALQPTARANTNNPTGTVCFPRDPALACTGANAVIVPTAFPIYDLALPFDEKHYGIRGDFNLSSKDSFNAKWRYQQSPETNTVSQSNGFFGDIPFASKNLNGAWTHQLGTHGVNEFKAAWQKLSVLFGGGCANALTGCILSPTEIGNAFTNITFTGITITGATMQSLGPATNLPQGRQVRVAQISDAVNWTTGQHTLNFGVDFRDLGNSVPFLPNFNGAFRFNSTARIVQNFPNFVTLAGGTSTINYKERDQFYFFQDDFKVKENLTLNLGIRYEYTGQPINTLNEISAAREANAATALWRQSLPADVRAVPRLPADTNNWAPRLGFAWSPRFGDGKFAKALFGENDATVIRGGFSMAYDPAFYNILLNVSTSAPMVFLNTINNTGTAAAPGFRLPANPTGDVVRTALGGFLQRNTFDPRLLNQTQVGADFHSPLSRQWSFGVQRQINRNNVAEVRYVGNRGIGLFQTVNRNPDIGNLVRGFNFDIFTGTPGAPFFPGFPNLVPAGVAPLTCVNDPATPDNEGACNNRILPGRGLIRSRENTGESWYHGLQARYNGRLFNQLTLGASYTFSKTLDNASEIFAFGEIAIAANPFDLTRQEKGLSGNDRPNAAAMNFIWDVPMHKDQKGLVGHFLGGWQLNGTYNLASGRTFTPSQFFNVLGLPAYQDVGFTNAFFGFDNIRGFVSNRNAPRDTVAITDIDAYLIFLPTFVPSPTRLYSLNDLNASNGATLRPVNPADVRYILNMPGAAKYTGNPFGNIPRNSERGPALNVLNIGIFKNTRIKENVRLQLRAELFNALNHPNPSFGVSGEDSLPDTFIDDAGVPGSRFNRKEDMVLSSRRVQFGLRLIF